MSWRDPAIHIQDNLSGEGALLYRTFVHEFGHLGFDLGDEYGEGEASKSVVCTTKLKSDAGARTPFSPFGEKAACIMFSQMETNKFCSDQGPNSHNYTPLQPDDCWAGILGNYSDHSGVRWTLKTPVTRKQIVGTLRDSSGNANAALPQEWNTNFVVNNLDWSTPLCKPFLQDVKFADGSPAGFATVFLLQTSVDSSGHTWISEGKTWGKTEEGKITAETGKIAVIGAHQGDKVMTITEFNSLSVCPSGAWPQGPLGGSDADSDGDHVPDAFDNCPGRFNPMMTDGVWFTQGVDCRCASNADCLTGLVCNTETQRCIQPNCRSDADCGAGRRCVGTGTAAACKDMGGTACTGNTNCGMALHCDSGPGTSGTNLCVPNTQTGQPGMVCSDNAQCASGNCSGLEPDYAVGWRPGTCSANSKKALGEYCFQQQQCASGLCGDTGVDANGVGRCMPNGNGLPGDICSRDNQCTSRNCTLAPRLNGGWQAGHCSASTLKALGDSCSQGNQCASSFCDAGLETSMTNRCMPNGDGQAGQICTNDKQCLARNCALTGNLAAAVPGTCAPKKGLNVACQADWQCASGYCESHSGTSWTYRCMPSTGSGQSGDPCSNDNQCAAQNCAGLTKDIYGAWVPGTCAVKGRLGDCCTAHNQCASTYCAPGPFQACDYECMPNKNGQGYDLCSDNIQCVSQVCLGLRGDGYNHWIPGHCSDLYGLSHDCGQHSECASGRCDRGNDSSHTGKCVPNGNGGTGDFCTDNRHCASRICVGLHQQGNDWIPGTCQ